MSGLRSGGTFFAPLGPRSPPKPPSPRTKIDDGGAEEQLALLVHRFRPDDHDGALALVVDRLDGRRGDHGALGGNRTGHLDRLLAVQHHRGIHLHGAAQVEHRGERRNDGERRQHLQVALVGELQVVGAAAHAERVQHDVALRIAVRDGTELLADGAEIDGHRGSSSKGAKVTPFDGSGQGDLWGRTCRASCAGRASS